MKKIIPIFSFLLLIVSTSVQAQTEEQSDTKKYIKASIGYGISAPYEDVDVYGNGFYAQGEFVYEVASWLDIRPYAGLILATTKDDDNPSSLTNQVNLKSDTKAFLLGGKVRLTAPIPWVAPYVEVGVGMSVGEFETITGTKSIKESGLLFHIPVSLGLELGPKHNFDIAFTYYFQNAAEQFAGAAAVGFTFPLN